MSSISGFRRVPTFWTNQRALGNIGRTNVELLKVQQQLASGLRVSKFSDDPAAASIIALLDDRIEHTGQRLRNLSNADSALNILDAALDEANKIALDARDLASEQANSTFSADERAAQSHVVESMIQSLYQLANRESPSGALFGGSTPGRRPIEALYGGYMYTGSGPGLITDIGMGTTVPITLGQGPGAGGAANAIGLGSTRVQGVVDLNPQLTANTRLTSLGGARGLGIAVGSPPGGAIEFAVNGGNRVRVELTNSDTVSDIVTRLDAAIRQYEEDTETTVLGAGGVSFNGEHLQIEVDTGVSLQFFEVASGTVGQDLGLVDSNINTPKVFTPTQTNGDDLAPKLTWHSPISSLAGVTGALGQIKLSNIGQSRIVDLSQAQTLQDVKNLIEGAGLGIGVEINAAGTGIDVINRVSAGKNQAMSIGEVAGSNETATRLGIRTMGPATLLSEFNDGKGVQIVDKATDPVTGLPDPAKDVDFTITLGDTAGTTFNVDLRPEDILTVQTMLARINSQAQAAGVNVPADFVAGLATEGNGITFTQNASFANAFKVTPQNNSPAADQLGLTSGKYESSTHTLLGQDRATVRVDSLFSDLLDLRNALTSDSTSGITLAGEQLESSLTTLSEVRGIVGGYGSRTQATIEREENLNVLDEITKSNLQGLDFAEAASRFSLLQTQLQAALQTTALRGSQTLLDYLG